MINFDFTKECYGCKNCENICPKNAIKMIEDENGFVVPIVDKKKCINCGLCEKKCPRINFVKNQQSIFDKTWYGAFNNNENELKTSTSGGIFSAFAREFIKEGNYVCGCIWNKDLEAIHVVSNEKNIIKKMCGSKYVQSNMNDCLKECKKILKSNKKILFTGTPCQIAAAKLFLGDNENILYMGIICEGAGPNKVWQKYKTELEKRNHSKLVNVKLRVKDICWDSPVAIFEYENGKIKKNLSFSYDKYMQGFINGTYSRETCYNCQYKGNNHNSDIIIGDLWGCPLEIRKDSNQNGASLVIINTEKGNKYFEKIKSNFNLYAIDKTRMAEENMSLIESHKMPKERNIFFKSLKDNSFSESIKIVTKKNRVKYFVKNLIYKLNLYRLLKEIKYRK